MALNYGKFLRSGLPLRGTKTGRRNENSTRTNTDPASVEKKPHTTSQGRDCLAGKQICGRGHWGMSLQTVSYTQYTLAAKKANSIRAVTRSIILYWTSLHISLEKTFSKYKLSPLTDNCKPFPNAVNIRAVSLGQTQPLFGTLCKNIGQE